MSKKRLAVRIVLDRSGSMEATRDATISAINEYAKTLAADPNLSSRLSVTIFDSLSIDEVIAGVKAREFVPMTRDTYQPRAMTPLNDAIGQTIHRVDAETRRDEENVALVIITDGLENASREFTKPVIKALIEERQKKGWLVLFLAANIDSFAEGVAGRGTSVHNTMDFAPQNIQATMSAAARGTMAYAATGLAESAAFTDEERRLAKDGGPKPAA